MLLVKREIKTTMSHNNVQFCNENNKMESAREREKHLSKKKIISLVRLLGSDETDN